MKKALLILLALVAGLYLILYRSDLSVRELVQRYRTPSSRYTTVDGMNVHYRIEGNPSDTLPLVLLHGTGSMLQTWDGWVQAMLGQPQRAGQAGSKQPLDAEFLQTALSRLTAGELVQLYDWPAFATPATTIPWWACGCCAARPFLAPTTCPAARTSS